MELVKLLDILSHHSKRANKVDQETLAEFEGLRAAKKFHVENCSQQAHTRMTDQSPSKNRQVVPAGTDLKNEHCAVLQIKVHHYNIIQRHWIQINDAFTLDDTMDK